MLAFLDPCFRKHLGLPNLYPYPFWLTFAYDWYNDLMEGNGYNSSYSILKGIIYHGSGYSSDEVVNFPLSVPKAIALRIQYSRFSASTAYALFEDGTEWNLPLSGGELTPYSGKCQSIDPYFVQSKDPCALY